MIFMDPKGVRRIECYFARIGEVLGNAKRRASFAVYAMGLLGGAERKSIEPVAALVCRDPRKMDAAHQRLLHFISDSRWSDRATPIPYPRDCGRARDRCAGASSSDSWGSSKSARYGPNRKRRFLQLLTERDRDSAGCSPIRRAGRAPETHPRGARGARP